MFLIIVSSLFVPRTSSCDLCILCQVKKRQRAHYIGNIKPTLWRAHRVRQPPPLLVHQEAGINHVSAPLTMNSYELEGARGCLVVYLCFFIFLSIPSSSRVSSPGWTDCSQGRAAQAAAVFFQRRLPLAFSKSQQYQRWLPFAEAKCWWTLGPLPSSLTASDGRLDHGRGSGKMQVCGQIVVQYGTVWTFKCLGFRCCVKQKASNRLGKRHSARQYYQRPFQVVIYGNLVNHSACFQSSKCQGWCERRTHGTSVPAKDVSWIEMPSPSMAWHQQGIG